MTEEIRFFLKKGIAFSFLLLFFILGLNFLYIHFVEKNTIAWRNYFEIDSYLKKNKQIDYAFFGTSRTRDSINPQQIPNSVNFSLVGQNYISVYYRLKYYLNTYDLDIKNIVLEIDPSSVSSRYADTSSLVNYDSNFYFPKKDLLSITGVNPVSYVIRSNFPMLGRGIQTYGFLRMPKTEVYLGWVKELGNFDSSNSDFDNLEKFLQQERFFPDSLMLEYFLKTIILANENNMNIFLLKNPYTIEYDNFVKSNSMDNSGYYREIFKNIDKRGIKYKIIDYYRLINDYFYFSDESHVNYHGSFLVSKKFFDDIIASSK